MPPLQVLHVAGVRPNLIKLAPVMRAMAERPYAIFQQWVHTGQHDHELLSEVIGAELGLAPPAAQLQAGPAASPGQRARVTERLGRRLVRQRPDWLFVYGDVSSTLAAAEAGAQLGVPVAHVEAGLRSFDSAMPEEGFRVRVDEISELLFTPSVDADENLRREGIPARRLRRVGNVMVDTLLWAKDRAPAALAEWLRAGPVPAEARAELTSPSQPFALATLHRPSNVDRPDQLRAVLAGLQQVARQLPVLLPLHPRTERRLAELASAARAAWPDVTILPPLPYLPFVGLQQRAAVVLTDSGGIQEETTALGVPCLTLRSSTERPITLTEGTNRLVEPSAGPMVAAVRRALRDPPGHHGLPDRWDGRAAERIVAALLDLGPGPSASGRSDSRT